MFFIICSLTNKPSSQVAWHNYVKFYYQYCRAAMKYDSFSFPGVRTLDYRNARYQGFLSRENKRQGFGILLDDDMNFYCSEWADGKMAANTLILLADGRYFYGDWSQGEPHGANVFKTKKTILFANYFRGQPKETMASFYQPTSSVNCFNAEQVQSNSSLQISSSQKVSSSEIYKEYIYQVAKKHGILLSMQQTGILDFMQKIANKFAEVLVLRHKGQNCYFGYQNGLGLWFTLTGNVSHHLTRISVGHHLSQKLLEIGAKYYHAECTEEGNFCTRELIAYNKFTERPHEKCHSIFQNTHRKALNFQNEYFEPRISLIHQLEEFIQKRLNKKCQQIDNELREIARNGLSKSAHKKIAESKFIDQNAEKLNPPKVAHKNADFNRQKSKKDLNLTPKKSKAKLPLEQNGVFGNRKLRNYAQQHTAVSQLVKHYNELRYHNAKSSLSKDMNGAPEAKVNKLREITRSKDKSRNSVSPMRELRYLKNYKVAKEEAYEDPSKNLLRKGSMNVIRLNADKSLNRSKNAIAKSPSKECHRDHCRKLSQHNMNGQKSRPSAFFMRDAIAPEAKDQKQLSQYQIQLKIRQEINQQERHKEHKELRNRQMDSLLLQRMSPKIVLPEPPTNPLERSSLFEQFADMVALNQNRNNSAYTPPIPANPANPRKLEEFKRASPNFDSYLQGLEDKREKILSEFRQMNRQIEFDQPLGKASHLNRNQSYHNPIHAHSSNTDFLDSPRKHPNYEYPPGQHPNYQYSPRKHSNYQQERDKDQLLHTKLSNIIYKNNDSPIQLQSFQYYPLNHSRSLNQQHYQESRVKEAETNKTRKKKYEYFFE